MSGKYVGEFGGKVELDTVELDWKVARKKWRHLKGGAEVISCMMVPSNQILLEEDAFFPEEG